MIGGIAKRLKDLKNDLAVHTGRDPRQAILEKAPAGSVYYSQPNPEVVQAKGFKIYIKYSPHGLNVVEWGTEDAPKKSITINSYVWTRKVVELIQRKSPMRFVRAYASMPPGEDHGLSHDEILFEMWKNSPCMHSGMPNKQAMRLLVGLRKHIPRGWVMMKGGNTAYPDRSIAQLAEACLVEQTGKGLMTGLKGYEVLKHWAETRGSFEPYLAAYLPKNWETEYKSRLVFQAMAGGSNEGSVRSRKVYR